MDILKKVRLRQQHSIQVKQGISWRSVVSYVAQVLRDIGPERSYPYSTYIEVVKTLGLEVNPCYLLEGLPGYGFKVNNVPQAVINEWLSMRNNPQRSIQANAKTASAKPPIQINFKGNLAKLLG